MFNLSAKATPDGGRIAREQAKADNARKVAEAKQARLPKRKRR
jgi:hypothetical protein